MFGLGLGSLWTSAREYVPGRADFEGVNRMIVVAAVIVLALIGMIWQIGIRDDAANAELAATIEKQQLEAARLRGLQHELSFFNRTGQTLSFWIREDSSPPPLPGTLISYAYEIDCPPAECDVQRNITHRFQVQRETKDPNALMAINAWLTATGEIVYANHMTQSQLDETDWHLRVTDQRLDQIPG